MKAALEYMRRGELVPDSTVWEMVRERSGCIRLLRRLHPRRISAHARPG